MFKTFQEQPIGWIDTFRLTSILDIYQGQILSLGEQTYTYDTSILMLNILQSCNTDAIFFFIISLINQKVMNTNLDAKSSSAFFMVVPSYNF